jgi:subtilisin family serine protease
MTSANQTSGRLVRALTMVLAIGALAVASTASAGASASSFRSSCTDQQDAERVTLVAKPGRSAAVLSRVGVVGGAVCDRFGATAEVVMPRGTERVFRRDVANVLPAARPYLLGFDEGVEATNAGTWHARGLAGAGVAVAVIDGGFGGLNEARAAGVVPASATTVNYCGDEFTRSRHGTAVAEVVAAEAPAAQLHLICVDDVVSLARAEAYVVAKHIPIVNHSVGWFNTGPGDGKGGPGSPDAIVAHARAHGVLWINAAGNEVRRHWRGSFVDADGDGWLEFAGDDETNDVSVVAGSGLCAFLRWYEWPNAQHEYDVTLYDASGGLVVAQSQKESPAPTRTVCWGNGKIWDSNPSDIQVMVRARGASGPAMLELFVKYVREIEHWVPAGSVADPATSPNALAVGAYCWATGEIEDYSSQGPTVDGRTKPELVAPDSVSSFTYGAFNGCGISGFAGTSAAAPHVAGAAALVKQRFPSYGPAKIQRYLVRYAKDLGDVGVDNVFGAGRLALP